jgi:class 3 adenylate cyclase/tetratricopeptide (TPR) repeat protein
VDTFTFLFTDIEGSTALLGRVGQDVYAQVLADHHAIIRSGLAGHGGREVDTQGDAFFAVFSSPTACVAAVLAMQQALAAHPWPGGERVRVRMGVHTGEASATVTGLVGLDVHRAARVAAAGHGGQVLVSQASAALVGEALPPGAALTDLGVHRLKDLEHPVRIFQLEAAGLPAEFPALRTVPGGVAAATRTLPRDLVSFTGRQRELEELVEAASEAGGVVGIHAIGGMAGVGKTAFAVHAAHRLADRFPAGQIFLPLHGHTPGQQPVDSADALASLLLTAGVPATQIPPGVEARMALWRDRLAEKQLLLILGDYPGAARALEEALGIFRDLGDRLGQANALQRLGSMRRVTRDYPGAARALDEALGIFRSISNRLGQANALKHLGSMRRETGDYPGAARALDEALRIYHDIGNRGGEAEALNEAGTLHRACGDLRQAGSFHQRALDLARQIGDSSDEAHALASLGRCARDAGHTARAEDMLRQALEVFRRIGAAEATDVSEELKALTDARPAAPGS